jgi:hypothetical protein
MKKIVLVLLMIVVFSGCFNSKEEQIEEKVEISGIISFYNIEPKEDIEGSIKILTREHNQDSEFKEVSLSTDPKIINGSVWVLNGIEKNKIYDIRAALIINDQEIVSSDIITVTAPAKEVNLPIRIAWGDLPEAVIKQSSEMISGEVDIKGYVPEKATITIFTAEVKNIAKNGGGEEDKILNLVFLKSVEGISASNEAIKW